MAGRIVGIQRWEVRLMGPVPPGQFPPGSSVEQQQAAIAAFIMGNIQCSLLLASSGVQSSFQLHQDMLTGDSGRAPT